MIIVDFIALSYLGRMAYITMLTFAEESTQPPKQTELAVQNCDWAINKKLNVYLMK